MNGTGPQNRYRESFEQLGEAEELTTVYQYFAWNGIALYVGITNRSHQRSEEHSSKVWWYLAESCKLEHFSNRKAALERERELIQYLRPPFNYQHNPDKRPGYNPKQVLSILFPDGFEAFSDTSDWYQLPKEIKAVCPCVRCGGPRIEWRHGKWTTCAHPHCEFCHKKRISEGLVIPKETIDPTKDSARTLRPDGRMVKRKRPRKTPAIDPA